MALKSLLESCNTRVLEAVGVADFLFVVDPQVLSHPVLNVLVLDVGLMLRELVHRIEPGLPMVLSKDVLDVADFTGDVVLNTGLGV